MPEFIGKNVCHTIWYDKEKHNELTVPNQYYELFKEIMDHYLITYP